MKRGPTLECLSRRTETIENRAENSYREFSGTREATFPRGGSRRESSCHTQMNVDVGHGGRGLAGSTSFPLRLFIAGTWTWASIAGSFEGSNDVGPVKVVSMVSPGPDAFEVHGGRGLAPLVELARGHGGRSR